MSCVDMTDNPYRLRLGRFSRPIVNVEREREREEKERDITPPKRTRG